MISKNEFVTFIKRLEDFNGYTIRLGYLDVNIWERDEYGYFCDSYVDMLVELMGKEHKEIINYFIFDLDFGRGYTDGCIHDNIDISTAEKLYDYIVEDKQSD